MKMFLIMEKRGREIESFVFHALSRGESTSARFFNDDRIGADVITSLKS